MLFISSIILFFILSITKIKSNNKPISFTIQIKQDNQLSIPLFTTKIGNSTIYTVYSGLNTSSTLFYAFPEKCQDSFMNGQCYKANEKKKTNQTKEISIFTEHKKGPVYKETVVIGNSTFDLEFIYIDTLVYYNGYINFGPQSLDYLKKNKIIPSSNIHFYPYNNGSINVTIGGNYNTSNKKYIDTCDIISNLSGCMLKKINIVNNEKKNDIKSFDLNIPAVFFNSELFTANESVVVGNEDYIALIKKGLINNNYSCDNNSIFNCQAPNKTLYLIFGKEGIKLSKISFYPKKQKDLVFGFNTFKDIDIVIDYDKKKVFFYSGTSNTPTKNSGISKIIIIISIIVGVLILGAILFYFLFHKKEKVNIETSGAETLLGEEN